MASEDKDEKRREIIRQLEYRYQQAQAKHLKAEAEAAEAKDELAKLQAARHRVHLPVPEGDICLNCWINHGRSSSYHAIQHDDPDHFDRMECEGCGQIDERRTGMT